MDGKIGKDVSRTIKIILDKHQIIWYNIDVVERLDCEPPRI